MHNRTQVIVYCGVALASLWQAASLPAAAPRKVRFDLSKQDFTETAKTLEADGFYPFLLSGYQSGGQERLAAVFEKRKPVTWEAFMLLSPATFLDKLGISLTKGYRPLNLFPSGAGDTVKISCICVKEETVGFQARTGLNREEIQKFTKLYGNDKFRPVSLRGYDMGSEARFAAVWEQRRIDSPATEVQIDIPPSAFNQAAKKLVGRNYAPVSLSAYTVAGKQRLAALWEKKPDGVEVDFRPIMTPDELQKQLDAMEKNGSRTVDLQAYAIGGKPKFCLIWDKEPPQDGE